MSLAQGVRYAFETVWADLAGWFFLGLLLAGVVAALVPEEVVGGLLGGGALSMVLALLGGIPLYICATSSTPVAAALIAQGASPGAALVFLLAGPATNAATITVLLGTVGRRATAVYLASIALCSVGAGLFLDALYGVLGLDATAGVGAAGHLMPHWVEWAAALALIALSLPVGWRALRRRWPLRSESAPAPTSAEAPPCVGDT